MTRTRAVNRTVVNDRPPRSRPSLARRSKPTKSLYVDDSSESNDESNSAISNRSDDDALSYATGDRDDSDNDSNPAHNYRTRPLRESTYTATRSHARQNKSPQNTGTTANVPSTPPAKARQSPRKVSSGTRRPNLKRSRPAQSPRPLRKTSGGAKSSPQKTTDGPPECIPDWRDPRVPYAAWVDILWFAGESGTETGWLVHAATSCKAFAEPALTALYRSPSIKSAAKAKKLVALLERPTESTLFNYRSKVQSLFINIETFPLAMIYQAVRYLKLLKELVIFSRFDQPPYRELDKKTRWQYPKELFRALSSSNFSMNDTETEIDDRASISLKSWEWSGRLLGGYVTDVGDIPRIHQLDAFAQLTKLSFTNFQVPSLHKAEIKEADEAAIIQTYQEDAVFIESIAKAISLLTCLKTLTFESSTVMNDQLLPLLPKDLEQLALVNCWEIRSEDFAAFLSTHGHYLRTLVLSHNQSLSLSFLTDLAETCPRLLELRMNLSYFRHHESVDDADPNYEEALSIDQVPLWPPTLRVIEIEHVRLWTVETAEMFVTSLITSAPSLSDLRYLAIKSMLNIPWQRRATLRQEWRDRLEKVFLRPWNPPKALTSLQPSDEKDMPVAEPTKRQKTKEPSSPTRRSGRIATSLPTRGRDANDLSGRLRGRGEKPLYREPDTDEDEYDDEEEEEEEGEDGNCSHAGRDEENDVLLDAPPPEVDEFIQGMCHTVSILFDNQKVREIQYGMEDFNDDDDESSGEEWNGDEDVDDPVFIWR